MKRSWTTYLLIGGFAALLTVLGVLQYRWLTQISESDGEKARIRLREQADRFAMDFNREIQNSYFNFQIEAEAWKTRDWAPFNERYDIWRRNSSYPELITDFYYFDVKSRTTLKYDSAALTFIEAAEGAEVAEIRARLENEREFKPVNTEPLTLFLPVHEPGKKVDLMIRHRTDELHTGALNIPERIGYLAIRLDAEVLKSGLIADLKAKYFAEGDYSIAISDEQGAPVYQTLAQGDPDARAPLFDLSSDSFVFFNDRALMKSIGVERKQGPVVSSHTETRSFNRVENGNENASTMRIQVKRDAKPRTSVYTMTGRTDARANPWTLSVKHASGSLDDFIASTRQRNLAIGFGVLLLLAAAVAAIIISSMRARALAQRQLDFVSSVSHEFRTPLSVIYSAGENLADGVAKETVQVSRYGDLIKGEGRKLSSMVEQILEFAGANSGRRKFNFERVSVSDIVDSAVAETQSLAEDRGFQVETSMADGLPPIYADKVALGQAIQNLIANSIKYSNGRSWVRVTASNGDRKVKISVEDRGLGISKGDLRQIFEPFYRSKAVVDAQIHGNGLGLSLVKQIVEAHGGTVKAESEQGVGSKFTIELKSLSAA